MARIALEGIVKDYGAVRAIHGIDLQTEDGEFVAFVGPSGCGKSTLLRMIAGLEEISAGTLRIGERIVNEVESRFRDVVMVFQDYALYPHMTIAENIGFGLHICGTPRSRIAARVAEAAKILQIGDLLERRPGQLSGGQRQRVAMGRAIVRSPQVFLFDEPLSNLDAKLRVEMRTQIKRLHAMLGTTTVYVTHDQVEAMTLADRVVILRSGELVQEARPNCRFVGEFIGSPQMNILSGTVDRSGAGPVLCVAEARVRLSSIDLPDGAPVHVGIRPEHLSWSDDNSLLRARLERLEPLGSDTIEVCLLGDQELATRLDPRMPVERSSEVPLTFESGNRHLFDPHSGERVTFSS